MKLATHNDKEHILEVLECAFKDNPTITCFSPNVNGKKNIRPILEYAYYYSMARKGVFLSEDGSCVDFFNLSTAKGGIKEKWCFIKLVLTCFNIRKIAFISAHIKRIKELKPIKDEYYHFWFLGSKGGTVKTTRRFIQEILEIAQCAHAPIYAETSLSQNEYVYSRYGFEKYGIVNSKELNLTVSLLRKEF